MIEMPERKSQGQPKTRELDMRSIETRLPKRWIGFLENVADKEDITVTTVLHQAVADFIRYKAAEYESENISRRKKDDVNQRDDRRLRTTAALDQSLDIYFDPFSAE